MNPGWIPGLQDKLKAIRLTWYQIFLMLNYTVFI
jgi:hypothetical protein